MSADRLLFDCSVAASSDDSVERVLQRLTASGTTCVAWNSQLQARAEDIVLVFLNSSDAEALDHVVAIGRRHPDRVLALLLPDAGEPTLRTSIRLLRAGAGDVIAVDSPTATAALVEAIVSRWRLVDSIVDSDLVVRNVIGTGVSWRRLLRQVVEAARFTQTPAVISGETGTGKELIARLIHTLDPKRHQMSLIVVDCTTLAPELAGSELFGHQRGAFTGAVTFREGALALADGGTLFLDEIGELPLALQGQLLRAVQERIYKPVGGNTWVKSNFRLVCATNRDLKEEVAAGRFRSDLYYRIAGMTCRTPPLRERVEDIPLLAGHFLREALEGATPPELSPALLEYVVSREYPGNVRDLRLLMQSMARSYIGTGCLTVRGIPEDQRMGATADEPPAWRDDVFEQAVRRALMLGAPLKDIGRAAEEIAVRVVLSETESTGEAARRLGVSPRAIQARRASMGV
jgi:transcriptional regulator with GAF, ATPase, and Fis domain